MLYDALTYLMPDRCTITREVHPANDWDEEITDGVIAENVPCGLSKSSGYNVTMPDQTTRFYQGQPILFVHLNVNIKTGDSVEVTTCGAVEHYVAGDITRTEIHNEIGLNRVGVA